MIINIRGTSGSGKSTLVTKIMALYRHHLHVKDIKDPKRKRPIGYILRSDNPGQKPLGIVGHYEIACGGTDTISGFDRIYEKVREAHNAGMDVLFEGLLASAEFERCKQLHVDGYPLLVIGLDTPLELCLSSVNARRRAKRGDDAPGVNPKNTESKYKGTKSTMRKLEAAGIVTRWASRDEALEIIKKELGFAS